MWGVPSSGPGLILHLGGSSPLKFKFLQYPLALNLPRSHPRKPTHRALCTDSQGPARPVWPTGHITLHRRGTHEGQCNPGQEETHSRFYSWCGELHTLHPLPQDQLSQTQGRQNPHPIQGTCLASVTLSTHTGRHLAGTHTLSHYFLAGPSICHPHIPAPLNGGLAPPYAHSAGGTTVEAVVFATTRSGT